MSATLYHIITSFNVDRLLQKVYGDSRVRYLYYVTYYGYRSKINDKVTENVKKPMVVDNSGTKHRRNVRLELKIFQKRRRIRIVVIIRYDQ